MGRSRGGGHRAGKVGAVRRSGQNRSGAGRCLCSLCRLFSGHGAVVSPVATAAGREARLCVGGKDCRKRPQPKQQNHENGNNTPHHRFILYIKHDPRVNPEIAPPNQLGRDHSFVYHGDAVLTLPTSNESE